MTTAPNPGVQNQMVPLPNGTRVRLQNGSVKTVLEHRYSGAANVLQYLVDKQKADWQSAKFCTVVQPEVTAPVIVPQPSQQAQSLPDGRLVAPATRHVIATDADHPNANDQRIYRTPGGLRAAQLDGRSRLFGANPADHPQILNLTTVTDRAFTSQARLTIGDYQHDDSGLHVNVLVEGVLDQVAVPHDLIEIVLTKPLVTPGKPTEDTQLETMLVLTPPVNENRIQFDAFYTWAQLARLLGLPTPGADLRHAVCTAFPQLGVEARWYDRLASGANGVLHTSGGNKLKDGSGQITLRPITQDDRKASEVVRNTDWNLSEVLRASRPVYVAYQDLLQPGKEMATTLEAESEFLVDSTQYQRVLGKLADLLHTPSLWSELGVTDLKCDDLDKENGEVKPRVSKDSYFDTPGLPLLTHGVVLRRREVKKDEAGVYLFAVKGRMVSLGGTGKERIRLASQVHLIDPVQQSRLEHFLADISVDNAFARVLNDALPGFDPSGVAIRLVVNSKRVKYTFTLENSTTVEFSADEATAAFSGKSAMLHCIEFGVGHPGLFIGQGPGAQGSGAQSSAAPVPLQPAGGTPLIMRPYHVAADLDNPALFEKRDYHQYQALRDSVLAYLFGTPEPKLELAGNKAQRLAHVLGMTKEK
ncbi:hypothetical protein ABZ646_36680 [Streptomyces sp. NPDC007162]|uniref:hypothetical protein n=1 Tax=Streptomyces sp. NPDC007162 TaxID=3156917 RepID=UPI0033C62507